MECLWCLFSHWRSNGYCHQQDQAVLHVYLHPHHGITNYIVHDPGFLEKYAPIYEGGEEKSVVLPLDKIKDKN